ncbi:MAG: hypothetical protein JWN23_389 [Rhodocyclales bacterium]|nr:hypothetical protein [Rhodocyclales bacterium]
MSQVIVALKGGLGNQLFEYAAGLALASRRGAELVLDVSSFSDPRARHFALGPFELPERIQQRAFRFWSRGGFCDAVLRRLSRRFGWTRGGVPVHYENSSRGFDDSVLTLEAPILLDGYFQSEQYFCDYAALLRERLSVPRHLHEASRQLMHLIRACDAICIHVRRGDYISNPVANQFHGLCGMDYYRRGVELVAEKLGAPHCFVFSDDPQWVRENMSLPFPTTVVDINGEDQAHQDLWLMAACRRFVIANSSLSWWGAWLSSHIDKQVVAPKQWFKGSTQDTSELVPADWIRV